MKRNKNQLGEAVVEVILEILLTLICFGGGGVFQPYRSGA